MSTGVRSLIYLDWDSHKNIELKILETIACVFICMDFDQRKRCTRDWSVIRTSCSGVDAVKTSAVITSYSEAECKEIKRSDATDLLGIHRVLAKES